MPEGTARNAQQRRHDTLARLEVDVDAWVATAGADGGGHCPTRVLKNTGIFVSKVSGSPLKGCLKEIDRA